MGTTTNGMLCTGPMAERMVREGLSIVGFSLAGTDDSQDAIRLGTRLQAVLQAIRQVDVAKKKLGSSLPDIHVAYIWLRSQLPAVKQLPALLEGMGVSQVVVSTLDFVPHQDLAVEALFARDEEEESFLRGHHIRGSRRRPETRFGHPLPPGHAIQTARDLHGKRYESARCLLARSCFSVCFQKYANC